MLHTYRIESGATENIFTSNAIWLCICHVLFSIIFHCPDATILSPEVTETSSSFNYSSMKKVIFYPSRNVHLPILYKMLHLPNHFYHSHKDIKQGIPVVLLLQESIQRDNRCYQLILCPKIQYSKWLKKVPPLPGVPI